MSLKFQSILTLRIDWSELDYFGHVNNVSFFKYIQSARVNYWDDIGLTQSHKETNIGPILASCKCDFKKPLYYPGEVTILTHIDFIKNTSFGICHTLIDQNKNVVATAEDIIVLFDFNMNKKVTFPNDLKDIVNNLEHKIYL